MTELDGNGHMGATVNTAGANHRILLAPSSLNNDPSIEAVKYTVTMRAPANNWVGLGFTANVNGVLSTGANSGPWASVTPSGIVVRGGHSVLGSVDVVAATHAPAPFCTRTDLQKPPSFIDQIM